MHVPNLSYACPHVPQGAPGPSTLRAGRRYKVKDAGGQQCGTTQAAAGLYLAPGHSLCQTWMCRTPHDADRSLNRSCHLVALGQCCYPARAGWGHLGWSCTTAPTVQPCWGGWDYSVTARHCRFHLGTHTQWGDSHKPWILALPKGVRLSLPSTGLCQARSWWRNVTSKPPRCAVATLDLMPQGQVALMRCSWTCAPRDVSLCVLHLGQPTVGREALVQGRQEESEEAKGTVSSEPLFWGQRGRGLELAGKLQTPAKGLLQPVLSWVTPNYVSCAERRA